MFFLKKVFFIAFFGSFIFNSLNAQRIYLLMVIQNDPNVGTTADTHTIRQLAKKIDGNLGKVPVYVKILDGAEATKNRIDEVISGIRFSKNDVFWYYYSGHGENYDTWPMTAEQNVPLTWVQQRSNQTKARLKITMYDACNWRDPIAAPPINDDYIALSGALTKPLGPLFLRSKGSIMISSASSTQFSYGSLNSGSFFTNSFVDALKDPGFKTWEQVLDAASALTEKLAHDENRKQNPKYEFSIGFIDSKIN